MSETIATNKVKHASGNPFMRWAIHQFHTKVAELLPDGLDTVLEVGCGEGFSSSAILSHRMEWHLLGGDISFEAVQEARSRFPAMHYGIIDATQLSYPDQSVDLILSLEVLEHIPQPERAVQEYMRVSRRYLLLSVPNEPIFRGLRLASGKGIRMLGDHPEHVNHWSIWGFRRFLEGCGLQVVATASPFPFSWSIILCEMR